MGSRHAVAGLVLLALGAALIVGYYFARPWLEDLQQRATSDAGDTRAEIAIGVDNWVGYFPLCSPVMKRRMREQGYRLRCEDDSADLAGRMAALRKGELQFAVATVDSYLLNGAPESWPGTIVMVIDESKGGDAVIARRSVVSGIDALKERSDLRVAFTPGSPSEHLVKAIATHFDIPALQDAGGGWRVETDGSEAAREMLESGAVDVAVLWEPDVSRALSAPEFTKLLGTEDTENLIVDVLVVGREFSKDEPGALQTLLHEYFRTLKHYRERPAELRADVAEHTKLPEEKVDAMLGGVAWMTLHDNAVRWFGLRQSGQFSRDGIVDAIGSALEILVQAGDFSSDPLPDRDPYRILHSEPLGALFGEGSFGGFATGASAEGLERSFEALDDAAWSRLREVGTLKVRPITFQSGTARLGLEGKEELDKAAENLRHYPNFRVVIEGHTGLRGDPEANHELSELRADAVSRYLQAAHGVDANRLRAAGRGSAEPLPRRPGEKDRAYDYRLPRVELSLVTEVY
ncbi:MAG: phosphate ABC transporter substrate-binding/OmpA family protein [Myxococcota bacterium]|nr:phosphate ABC transporter substrate-binding/OmpA family protein [Myxococcota bacterium]